MITFHNDIPMPGRASGRTSKYPFHSLAEVGQCFIETEIVDSQKAAARVTAAVGSYRRAIGPTAPKFSVRVFQIAGQDAIGVWRV